MNIGVSYITHFDNIYALDIKPGSHVVEGISLKDGRGLERVEYPTPMKFRQERVSGRFTNYYEIELNDWVITNPKQIEVIEGLEQACKLVCIHFPANAEYAFALVQGIELFDDGQFVSSRIQDTRIITLPAKGGILAKIHGKQSKLSPVFRMSLSDFEKSIA